MTAIVGVRCENGIVIGTDSSATFSAAGHLRTIEQPFEKLEIIKNRIIIAGTGQIGLGQRFCEAIKDKWEKNAFSGKSPIEFGKTFSKLGIEDFTETQAIKGRYGALVAFPCKSKSYLCELGIEDFQPELKTEKLWYGSMGSTQPMTDSFLALVREIFWKDGPPANINDAIFVVVWALELAIQANPGGVNGPIRIAILDKNPNNNDIEAHLLSDDDLEEHRQFVEEIKNNMRKCKFQNQNTIPLPNKPA